MLVLKCIFYTFIYLHKHVQSTVKYVNEEFAKIVNGLWLLAIFPKDLSGLPDWVLNLFLIYLF